MARTARWSGSQDLIGRISDTIAEHPRVSAAAAFQMGVLLGQAMQNAGSLKRIGRKLATAPAALASSIPTFGLFEASTPAKTQPAQRKSAARSTAASARKRGAKRSKGVAHA
jgi:hypothetical protein